MFGLSHLYHLSVSLLSLLWSVEPEPSTQAQGLVSAAWWTNWREDFPVYDVPWDGYTHMTYAFAETAPDTRTLSFLGDESGALLSGFVSTAHNNDVKALLSIGGWGGSIYWSTAVGSSKNRTTFVNTLLNVVKKYDLDGLDFDWEYPGQQGLGCNTISSDDTKNFLAFIRELRADKLGSSLVLTAATSIRPFIGSDGNPSADVSGFAEVLNWIAIMDYDVWGPWSATVGPNAPLDDSCAPPEAQQGSAVSAVQAWTEAGMPVEKIVLGVASYGHSFIVSPQAAYPNGHNGGLALYPEFDGSGVTSGKANTLGRAGKKDSCVAIKDEGDYDFRVMVDEGYLEQTGEPTENVGYVFDECTQTPFLYFEPAQLMIAYDDPASFAAKGQFIKDNGLAGFAMWEAGADYQAVLLDAILSTAT